MPLKMHEATMNTATDVTTESWKQILATAVAILDDLEQKGFGSPDLVIGGGTVLMFRFQHRLSKDIDLFLHDVQWLSLLTPRLNDTTAAMVTDYVEQANIIKLIMPHGDIDFVAAAAVTDAAPIEKIEFMGRTFSLEQTEEILAKKLLFRAESLKPRDVFDLVTIAELDNASAVRAIDAAASKRDILKRRLEHMAGVPPDDLARDILPIGEFSRIFQTMVETARRLVTGSSGMPRGR
jgi:predicted nucleotidyltransferase component of viral defense system